MSYSGLPDVAAGCKTTFNRVPLFLALQKIKGASNGNFLKIGKINNRLTPKKKVDINILFPEIEKSIG